MTGREPHPDPGPPRAAESLLRWLLPPHDRGPILGDLNEEFVARRREDGAAAARRWYRRHVARSVLPALARRGARPALGDWHPLRELRWAWRGVRARGWRAAFVVALFAGVLAANTVVFSAADAFVFRTVPYPDPDGLVVITQTRGSIGTTDYLPREVLAEWRKHSDLFAGVHAHAGGASAYLAVNGVTEAVRAAAVTPGMFELLGVVPTWGRPFVEADAAPGSDPVVIIRTLLARRLFGSAEAAIGRPLPEGNAPPTIVGVMPESFRFPTSEEAIWRPLRLAPDPAARYPSNLRNLARLAPGVDFDAAAAAVDARSPVVGGVQPPWPTASEIRRGQMEAMRLTSLGDARRNAGAALIFAMLAGAAVALLLIACANVASLELAAASRQARGQAVQAALGASRGSLARIAGLEAGLLLAISAVLAAPLAIWGTSILADNLSVEMRTALTNPLDLDLRAIGVMLAVAGAALLVTSFPGLRRLARLSILDGLRDDTRVMPVTRSAARTRQLLMGGQVALAVLLLSGSALFIRTYLSLAGIDRGFDGSGLVTIGVGPADDAPRRGADLESLILDRLRAAPGVRSVARAQLLPPSTEAGSISKPRIVGRAREAESVMLASYAVDPEYFDTVGIVIVEGRPLTAFGLPDEVIVNEAFARRFWPDGGAIGARFDMQGVSLYRIAGVARDFRQDRQTRATGEAVYVLYVRLSPTTHPLRFVARLDDERLLPAVTSMVRATAERSVVRTETMATRYARLDADKRLAASITTGFGALALVIATAGIYGVMTFLVAGRSREIGVRMALGADRGAVQRLVFRSSLTAVVSGAAIGVAAALLASRSIASQLYGVTPTDPPTYAAVCALIVATAIVATWLPARRAARMDPAVTLRAD